MDKLKGARELTTLSSSVNPPGLSRIDLPTSKPSVDTSGRKLAPSVIEADRMDLTFGVSGALAAKFTLQSLPPKPTLQRQLPCKHIPCPEQ